ncbi:MAGE family-domain-containing protein [Obelidium mucronatum]|nr:MAGE family-domain-containing protein [Obelidium mucronatum]
MMEIMSDDGEPEASQQPLKIGLFTTKALDTSNGYVSRSVKKRDADRFVKGFVRMALGSEHKRVPIKREDLIKKVLTMQHSKAYASIFEKAQKVLRKLFGMEMVRLDAKTNGRTKDKGKAKEATLRQEYILVNILPKEHLQGYADINGGAERASRTTLLCVVLSLVIAEKRVINSDSLYKHLEVLGINKNRLHTTFGKIEDVIASFVKEEYLEKHKTDDAGQQQQQQTAGSGEEFVWGARAKAEYSEAEIIEFVAKMFPASDAAGVQAILRQTI